MSDQATEQPDDQQQGEQTPQQEQMDKEGHAPNVSPDAESGHIADQDVENKAPASHEGEQPNDQQQ